MNEGKNKIIYTIPLIDKVRCSNCSKFVFLCTGAGLIYDTHTEINKIPLKQNVMNNYICRSNTQMRFGKLSE